MLFGVDFGVTIIDFASSGVVMAAAGPGDLAGDLDGDLTLEGVKGVDMARVRGVAGTVFELTCVSDSDVKSDTATDRTLRREAATDGAEGPLRGIGTLF